MKLAEFVPELANTGMRNPEKITEAALAKMREGPTELK